MKHMALYLAHNQELNSSQLLVLYHILVQQILLQGLPGENGALFYFNNVLLRVNLEKFTPKKLGFLEVTQDMLSALQKKFYNSIKMTCFYLTRFYLNSSTSLIRETLVSKRGSNTRKGRRCNGHVSPTRKGQNVVSHDSQIYGFCCFYL